VSPPASPGALRVAFTGADKDFRSLVLRGGLLELVTLAFYRFWLVTDIRRHLWSQTSAGDDALEYTGRPKELLFGFLVALAVLVPFYLAFAWLGLEAERLAAFASLPLLVLFYALYEFAIYRSRRYRLTRTLWRGTRFWMDGSGAAYAWRVILWGLLTILTLGLAFPWRAAALERYKMSHTYYGDLAGRFDGSGWTFFKRGWWLWLLPVLLGVFIAVALVMGMTVSVDAEGEPVTGMTPGALLVVGLLVGVVGGPFAYAWFKAIERKWWAEGLSLGDVRFSSDLRGNALVGTIWKFIGAAMVRSLVATAASGGIAYGLASVYVLVSRALGGAADLQSVAAAIAAIVGYIVTLAVMLALQRIYLLGWIWKIVASSIVIDNLDSAEHAVGKGAPAGVLGEGIVDTLDFAGF